MPRNGPKNGIVGIRVALLGLITTALLSTGIGSCKDSRPDASAQLISAFQGSCVTSGQWTQSALSQTQSLITVLENLKATDPCKPFTSTLTSIQGMSQQINSLLTTQSYTDYRTSEETLQELTLALQGSTPGSDNAQGLAAAVLAQQIDLAEKRATSDADTSATANNNYVNATQQFATQMTSILQDTQGGLSACLQQSPAAALELATSFLAIGGSFVSPIFGAGTQVVSQLFNLAVEYIRTAGTDEAIYSLYSAEMPVALSCGLESMSELYCDADDAAALLNLQAQSYPNPGASPDPLWQGLDLEGRRLPWLEKWLEDVKNGVLPTDPSEAQTQNQIWDTLHKLDDYYRWVYGTFADRKEVYSSTTDASQQQTILVQAIADVASYLVGDTTGTGVIGGGGGGGGSSSNPFLLKSNDERDYACWMVWGVTTTDCQKVVPGGLYQSLDDYIQLTLLKATPQANFDLIQTNWEAIYAVVQNLVQLEFAHTITSDPDSLLAEARQKASSDAVSAYDTLKMIQAFLSHLILQDDGSNPQLKPLVIQTQDLVNQAITALDEIDPVCVSTPASDDCKTKELARIEQIFEIFQLNKSIQFFLDRMGKFVEWDLQYKIDHNELPTDVTQILLSAGTDIRNRVLASGISNLELVSQDLNQSRADLSTSLATFRSYFADSIGKSITSYAQLAKSTGEAKTGANRPYGQVLGQLCTLVLSTGTDWPKNVPWNICSTATLSSIYPDPKGTLGIDVGQLSNQLKGVPLEQRMCSFHRFLRASRMAEILNEQPVPAPSGTPSPGPSAVPAPTPSAAPSSLLSLFHLR